MEKPELKFLSGPFEFLEFKNGESVRLVIMGFEEGLVTVHPRGLLRLWLFGASFG